jgi:hypothetical protein
MTTTQWVIGLIAALIGGGAMGAVITALVTRHRNRRQPIGYSKDIINAFKHEPEFSSLQIVLMENDNPQILAKSLSIARFTFINKGNQDMEQFNFGITLGGTSIAVQTKEETPDRHHIFRVLKGASVINPTNELDFELQPFNRGEKYSLSVYFTYNDSPGPVDISTHHSTTFVELGTPGELSPRQILISKILLIVIIPLLLASAYGLYGLAQLVTYKRIERENQRLIQENEIERKKLHEEIYK